MPAGFERLNVRRSQPNARIVFIKPLPGPDEAVAQDFLERIAAQCFPIMRDNSINVTSLEQYEFNREFVGRNFNAGEVIQLVLKAQSGRWLPFDYVQMVMMHELAHCKQMNHSKAFWAVRNSYAEAMRSLWIKGYTGEGLWGRGQLLRTGQFTMNTVRPDEPLPEHLCGGTYASRSKRRRAQGAAEGGKKVVTAEERRAQKERRILKKFGRGGQALGMTEASKASGESEGAAFNGKPGPKPRVAGSKRGRELRAAAALARFDQSHKEKAKENPKTEIVLDDDTTAEVDMSTNDDDDDDDVIIVDVTGRKLLDGKGRGMVKVCGDEDDIDCREELRELQRFRAFGLQKMRPGSSTGPPLTATTTSSVTQSNSANGSTTTAGGSVKEEKPQSENQVAIGKSSDKIKVNMPMIAKQSTIAECVAAQNHRGTTSGKQELSQGVSSYRPSMKQKIKLEDSFEAASARSFDASIPRVQVLSSTSSTALSEPEPPPATSESTNDPSTVCPVCSFSNCVSVSMCSMCGHVLRPSMVPGTWRCRSKICAGQGSRYVNPGDYGTCGVCGAKK